MRFEKNIVYVYFRISLKKRNFELVLKGFSMGNVVKIGCFLDKLSFYSFIIFYEVNLFN